MMKRIHSALLVGLVAVSLFCSSSKSLANNHDGFIAGACAAGAALFGVAGVVALVDWCCSETDEQLIARANGEYCSLYAQYYEVMAAFSNVSGMNQYASVQSGHAMIYQAPESELYEFATCVWHKGFTQYQYRSNVFAAKNQLDGCVQSLRKRTRALEGKCHKYEDQQRLRVMRKLLSETEELLYCVSAFAHSLESHKTYFNLYDSIDAIRSCRIQEITIIESGRYSVPIEIKNYVLNNDNGQYAFSTFVTKIEKDIATLRSDIRRVECNYPMRRQYAHILLNKLIDIKNILITDPRYQHELYQWEQAQLQRQHVEALEAQARAERDHARAMRKHNKLVAERNRIERERLYRERQCCNAPHANIVIDVVV